MQNNMQEETPTTFIETADSRETSREIMEAIWTVSGKDDAEAVRIWTEPRPEELTAIWEIVTSNGVRKASEYQWGASGSGWYQEGKEA